jgi:hypothetical protein
MDKIATDFKDKGVLFYNLYTREPHPGQDTRRKDKETGIRSGDDRMNFTEIPQTKTMDEREEYALKMLKDWNQVRPIMIDIFGDNSVQKWLGGNAPNSLAVIDREGKLALWQTWSEAKELRAKIEEMTTTAENQ